MAHILFFFHILYIIVSDNAIQIEFPPNDVSVEEHDDAILFCGFKSTLNKINIFWEKETGKIPDQSRRTIVKMKPNPTTFVRINLHLILEYPRILCT